MFEFAIRLPLKTVFPKWEKQLDAALADEFIYAKRDERPSLTERRFAQYVEKEFPCVKVVEQTKPKKEWVVFIDSAFISDMTKDVERREEETEKRKEQCEEMTNSALMERNRSQDLMIKYQTLSLALAEALRREQTSV